MNSIPPMPESWQEQRPYLGNINRVGSANLIKDILAAKPHTQFHFVLGRILEKLVEENSVLAFSNALSVPSLAWATRNIMELRILSRYICKSQSNVDRFQADVLTLGATTLRAMTRLHNDLAKEVGGKPVSPELHRNQAELESAREEAGLVTESALMARACAKRVGLEKEYFALSGATSLLVHPTAISVLKTFDLDAYREVITMQGLILASKVILEARSHVAKHGYSPAD